jgi:hypothetical protein
MLSRRVLPSMRQLAGPSGSAFSIPRSGSVGGYTSVSKTEIPGSTPGPQRHPHLNPAERPCPASRSRQGALGARTSTGGANPSNPSVAIPLPAIDGRGVLEQTTARRSDAPILLKSGRVFGRGLEAIRPVIRGARDPAATPRAPHSLSSEPSAVRVERHAASRRAISVSPIAVHSISSLSFTAKTDQPPSTSRRAASRTIGVSFGHPHDGRRRFPLVEKRRVEARG